MEGIRLLGAQTEASKLAYNVYSVQSSHQNIFLANPIIVFWGYGNITSFILVQISGWWA